MTSAAPLPAALYAGPEAFQRERRTVFQAAWLMLARADQVRAPRRYVAQSLGGWPVFAIADAAGTPHAFRNVCRHQGLPLFDSGTGECAEIRCRYHGWTYDAAGNFRGAPPQSAPLDPADPLHHLGEVATAVVRGLLLVHLGTPGERSEIGAALESLAFAGESVSDIDANWKLVVEEMLRGAGLGGAREFLWPTLIVDAHPDGAVVHQVIPRAFQRTRIHHHRYGTAAVPDVAAIRAAALAAQARLTQAKEMQVDVNADVAAFRARVASAHPVTTS